MVKWPGRNQVIPRKNITFYVDGAHTVESLRVSIFVGLWQYAEVSFLCLAVH